MEKWDAGKKRESEIAALKQRIAGMEDELHKCNVLEAAITKECNALKEKIWKLEAEDISNGAEICKYKTLYDAMLTRVIKLEAEVSYHETENKHLKEQVRELEERRSETVAMCEQLLAENQRLREALENVLLAIEHEDYYNDEIFDDAREALGQKESNKLTNDTSGLTTEEEANDEQSMRLVQR